MILNQAQAEAVYSAMCALNNVGAMLRVETFNAHRHAVTVIEDHAGVNVTMNIGGIVRELDRERYANQAAFAAAYGLQ
jgi:hypothetical protein